MKCIYQKPNGEQCSAYAMTGCEFCFTHNPATQNEKKEAVLKGGKALKPRASHRVLKPIKINTASDTLALLEDTINRVRTDPMTPQQAQTIGTLISLAFKAMDKEDAQGPFTSLSEYMNKGPHL